MKRPRIAFGSLVADRRIVATVATLLAAAAILVGLGLANAAIDENAADADALQARLDELLRRPLPPPAPAVVPPDPSERDIRVFAASSAGAAASSLQDMLSAHAVEAGLSVERMTIEPATGDDQSRAIVLRLEASGTINALQAALFRIESGFPYLFVDELELQRPIGAEGDQLAIVATIRADWKELPP